MNPDELVETKAELDAFVEEVFASLPRISGTRGTCICTV